MNPRALTAAVAVLFALSMPRAVAAKGNGGGHSSGHSGGHAGGGHSGSARSSGGQARSGGGGARTGGGGSARGGTSQPAPTPAPAGTVHGGGRVTVGGSAAGGTSQPHTGSRSPNGHLVVGTAAPR